MTWTALGNWADNPNDAKGKIMTLDSLQRSPKIPTVPTYREAGLGDYPIHTWAALFAPGDVPDAVVAQVNDVVGKVINTPSTTEFLVNQLIEPMVTSPPEFAAFVERERVETGKLLRKFSIPRIQ